MRAMRKQKPSLLLVAWKTVNSGAIDSQSADFWGHIKFGKVPELPFSSLTFFLVLFSFVFGSFLVLFLFFSSFFNI